MIDMYPFADATPPNSSPVGFPERVSGNLPPIILSAMKRIMILVVLIVFSAGLVRAQDNEWNNLGEKAGLVFMYKVSDCESGAGILLRIINPGSMDPAYEKFIAEIVIDGQSRNFIIDISKLEKGVLWEGNCEEMNKNLRLLLGTTSGIESVQIKLPSEI